VLTVYSTSVLKFFITNARMVTTTKNMASIVFVCLIPLGLTDFSESQGILNPLGKYTIEWEAVANCQGICLVIVRFWVRGTVGAFCYCCFLGQETLLPLPLVAIQLLNREHIVNYVIRAQLKSSFGS